MPVVHADVQSLLPDISGSGRHNRFQKNSRLLKASDYSRVFDQPLKSSDNCFIVLARQNQLLVPRLGLAVAKKNARRAVARNRIKRLIRESFRLNKKTLQGLDIVVMIRPNTCRQINSVLFSSLENHWQRLFTKIQSGS